MLWRFSHHYSRLLSQGDKKRRVTLRVGRLGQHSARVRGATRSREVGGPVGCGVSGFCFKQQRTVPAAKGTGRSRWYLYVSAMDPPHQARRTTSPPYPSVRRGTALDYGSHTISRSHENTECTSGRAGRNWFVDQCVRYLSDQQSSQTRSEGVQLLPAVQRTWCRPYSVQVAMSCLYYCKLQAASCKPQAKPTVPCSPTKPVIGQPGLTQNAPTNRGKSRHVDRVP